MFSFSHHLSLPVSFGRELVERLFLQVEVRTILSHVALLHLEVLTVQEMPGVALSVLTTMSLPCSRSTEGDLLFEKNFSRLFDILSHTRIIPESGDSWSLSFAFPSFDE